MKKILKFCSLLLFSFGITTVCAQQSNVASGANISGSGGSISYSLGQVVYATNTGSTGSVAQGVQQAFEIFSVGINENEFQISLNAFPNPTTTSLVLITETLNSEMNYQLTNAQGQLLESKKMEVNEVNIAMHNFSAGLYFLKVTSNNKEVKTFKIIKN